MRVVIDPNVFISYLLKPEPDKNPTIVVEAAFRQVFVTMLPDLVFVEMRRAIETRPYLSARITQQEVERFEILLKEASERVASVDSIGTMAMSYSRDEKDDYLFVLSLREAADYLVSGDKDLLVLDGVMGVRVVDPAAFVRILQEADQPAD